ncbi:Transcription factor of the Forkhead/HNF3 family [Mycobacteroides abscessus subsp. bolletii]|uniref:hypothetical protein n=2 Tax=Mycobacteroides abscessus TaxID=36809 RepID=UPI0009A6624F|nr:hypothetical protein [Mycobacteroides abscessus]SKH05117.1 Transcription factor of the Forkhead/HNF3 family [Mycobacteroides abscessus subsp. bolletii]
MTDTDRPDGDDAPTQTLPAAAPLSAPELTGFPAGIVGAALTVLGVWGLHVLTRGDGVAGAVGWVILLCLAFSALGKGITLLRRALAPLSAVLSASVDGVPAGVRAATGIVIGSAGMWWVLRGHASLWWAQVTGAGSGWSLFAELVLVAIMVVAGALLFGGAKVLGKLIFANSGTRQQPSPNHDGGQRWRQWWASHPGLGLTLLAGGGALVFLSGYVVPRVSSWLTGDDPMAALAAITAILTLALLANTWWWRALSGWWAWAHTPNGPGGPTPIGQIYAGAGVLALIGFSATAFGLATFSSYLPSTAAVASADPCPPDCGGGGGNNGGPQDGGMQFRPPDMPAQQPDYQGGINQAPLNQNSGISIYNETPGQGGQAPQQNMGPQMPGQRAAHGEPLPNYGPWQPDAQPPAQAPVQQAPQPVQQAPAQQPVQQAPQAPQQPAQAPQNPAGQQPAQQAPQQPPAQQPQGQPGQQPAQQSPTQSGQTQPGQTQPGQQPQKEPEAPKKNPMDPTDLASAATRRGSQQAGEQAGQQAVQQGTQQATQQAPKSTAQTQQAPQSTQQGQQTPKPAQQNQQAPQQTKQIKGRPKGIDGAPKGTPEEQPWDITGEVKPVHEQFPNGGQKIGVEGRYGIQNKDPISIGQGTVGNYDLSTTLKQDLGLKGGMSITETPETVSGSADASAGYNLENKSLVSGPGIQGTLTNTLHLGPSVSKGPESGTPIGSDAIIQNLGNGRYFVNLPISGSPLRLVNVGSTFKGVVDVPRMVNDIRSGLGQAGQWISSGIPSVFGP